MESLIKTIDTFVSKNFPELNEPLEVLQERATASPLYRHLWKVLLEDQELNSDATEPQYDQPSRHNINFPKKLNEKEAFGTPEENRDLISKLTQLHKKANLIHTKAT